MKFEVLDAKDVAVLSALDKNSRLTYSQIARTVKLSKQSVEYRINSLQRKNILKNCMPIVDYRALGYYFYRVYLQFTGLAPEEEQKILQFIFSIPKVYRIALLDGTWDCTVTILAKEPSEVRETMDVIQSAYGPQIKSKMILVATSAEMYTYKFLNPDFEIILLPSGEKNPFQLDELDKGILDALTLNARTSLIEMAAQLNTSYKVISYRIKRLEKVLIRSYRLEINHAALGLARYRVFVELQNNKKEKQDELLAFLRGNPSVISFTRVIGKFDLEINCTTKDAAEFHAMLTLFRSKYSDLIKDYSICLITEHLTPKIKQKSHF